MITGYIIFAFRLLWEGIAVLPKIRYSQNKSYILSGPGGRIRSSIWDSLSFLKSTKKQESADMGNRRLLFKAVTGSFIESNNVGQLFVIKGMVTNKYPKDRSFILTKGSLLDDNGRVVKKKMAYAGNTFIENEIKEMSLEEIDKGLKNRLGKGRMNFNIKPDGTIPFMIVFSDLPDNLSEFTVEAVSSSPGDYSLSD